MTVTPSEADTTFACPNNLPVVWVLRGNIHIGRLLRKGNLRASCQAVEGHNCLFAGYSIVGSVIAVRAIDELGLKGKAFTAGTGMPAANAQILKDGSVSALTLWDPADAGYALASLATKILKGEKIEDGVDLGVEGYENMHFAPGSNKVLEGNGWLKITKDNVDSLGF